MGSFQLTEMSLKGLARQILQGLPQSKSLQRSAANNRTAYFKNVSFLLKDLNLLFI